ncbi:MAG: hypothetical protein HOW73_31405 [Polyangiaceae bacterium]|nr:hypothetical protein [Polyangiaceae bacterium]
MRSSLVLVAGPISLILAASCGARDALLGDGAPNEGGAADGGAPAGGSSGDGGFGGVPNVGRLVAAGAFHTCATDASGTAVYCWGRNNEGQLGTGDFEDSSSPRLVALPATGSIIALTAGYRHTCAVVAPNDVFCWGENGAGQVGVFRGTPVVETPTAVPLPDDAAGVVTTLTAGEYHSCAGLDDGSVACWGDNTNGQLGMPTMQTYPNPPLSVGPVGPALTAGDFHTCSLTANQSFCWGANFDGQLGNGKTAPSNVPVATLAGPLRQIESKAFTTLALDDTGAMVGWGENFSMLLSTDGFDITTTPIAVHEGERFSDLAVGIAHACAITLRGGTGAGSLRCWGDNSNGQLGDGTQNSSAKLVAPLEQNGSFTAFDTGGLHTCAFAGDSLYCWGQNDEGRCGQPPPGPVLVPTKVDGI